MTGWNASSSVWYMAGMFHLGGAIIGFYHGNNDTTYMIHREGLGSTSMLTNPAGGG